MSGGYVFEGIYPIGDTDPNDLPVRDLASAIPYYAERFGFKVAERGDDPAMWATLERDGIRMRLAENGGEPEQASCYISVSDVDAAFQEFQEKSLDASAAIRTDEYGGKKYRVFFVRAPDGLCFCLGHPSE